MEDAGGFGTVIRQVGRIGDVGRAVGQAGYVRIADVQEWNQEVYPNLVIPLLEEAIRKVSGPGRMVEIMPGVRGWKPDKPQGEDQ